MGAPAKTVERARRLRKNMSLPEVLLWRELRGQRPKFRKQFGVVDYVADFACLEARLIFEIDGFAHETGDRPARDERRTRVLEGLGWQVIRIAASRVLADPTAVAEAMLRRAEAARPLHRPR